MPDFTWKWFWEKLFEEFEGRDLLVVLLSAGVFVLIYYNKIPETHVATVISGLIGYALGRPNLNGGGNGGGPEKV